MPAEADAEAETDAARTTPPRPSTDPRGPRRPRGGRARHALTLDAARPDAVAKRHEQGRRTARENLADLIDAGSFVEYGPLIFAAQERRRPRRS